MLIVSGMVSQLPIVSSAAVLAYAVVFGFAQQLVTGFIDRRAGTLAKETLGQGHLTLPTEPGRNWSPWSCPEGAYLLPNQADNFRRSPRSTGCTQHLHQTLNPG